MSDSKSKKSKGKLLPLPSSAGNKLHCTKSQQLLASTWMGEEFCPRLPSPRDSSYSPQEGKIAVLPDQTNYLFALDSLYSKVNALCDF